MKKLLALAASLAVGSLPAGAQQTGLLKGFGPAAPTPPTIALVNPAVNEQAVTYDQGNELKKLEPGKMDSIASPPVNFERGPLRGVARYTVANGVYEFRRGRQRRALATKTFQARIDNTQGTEALQYQIDGKTTTVAPGLVPGGRRVLHRADSERVPGRFAAGTDRSRTVGSPNAPQGPGLRLPACDGRAQASREQDALPTGNQFGRDTCLQRRRQPR